VVSTRTPTLDVARAIALIGVVVMNYHAYLNPKTAYFQVSPSIWDRAFNPLSGILTSRFAAAFVLIAGIGVSLMTNRVREAGDVQSIHASRLVLLRRGFLLYVVGYGLQWIWPGTILFYYGAFFMLASFIVAKRSQVLVAIAALCVAIAHLLWPSDHRCLLPLQHCAWQLLRQSRLGVQTKCSLATSPPGCPPTPTRHATCSFVRFLITRTPCFLGSHFSVSA